MNISVQQGTRSCTPTAPHCNNVWHDNLISKAAVTVCIRREKVPPMNVCFHRKWSSEVTDTSIRPTSGGGGVLVCFSVISLGGKGHRDVKRRFSLRAEIKPHTCDRLGSCPDVWLCWFPSDCRSSTSITQLMQNIYITLWPNNTARLFIKLPDSKHHFKSKCWLSAGLNVTRFTRRYRYLIALGGRCTKRGERMRHHSITFRRLRMRRGRRGQGSAICIPCPARHENTAVKPRLASACFFYFSRVTSRHQQMFLNRTVFKRQREILHIKIQLQGARHWAIIIQMQGWRSIKTEIHGLNQN